MPLRSIHVVANGRISFFFMGNIHVCVCVCMCVCVCDILFIHLSIDGRLGCFHVLAIVNNAAMNMEMQASLCDSDFILLGILPKQSL